MLEISAASDQTDVIIILGEEFFGVHRTPEPTIVLLANAPWLFMPAVIIARMWSSPRPFTRAAGGRTAPVAQPPAIASGTSA